MTKRKHSIGNSTALLLIVALLAPPMLQFLHIFERYEDYSCTELTGHMDQCEGDCTICDFQLASFTYTIHDFPERITSTIEVISEIGYNALYSYFSKNNTQDRAPPFFSVFLKVR